MTFQHPSRNGAQWYVTTDGNVATNVRYDAEKGMLVGDPGEPYLSGASLLMPKGYGVALLITWEDGRVCDTLISKDHIRQLVQVIHDSGWLDE